MEYPMMSRLLTACLMFVFLATVLPSALLAQDPTPQALADPRASTGGAQTLKDIMARQAQIKIDDEFRSSQTGTPDAAKAPGQQLGTLGGASDAEVFRAIRYGTADINSSARGPAATVLIQDGGMRWLDWRRGPLPTYGGYLLLGMTAVILLFYLLRGRIMIEGEKTGETITRFKSFERFSHWLMAGSFILLGLTGLFSLFGRLALIPLLGHEVFSPIAGLFKWVHNNVAWAFMLSLIFVLVLWIKDNFPHKSDFNWLLKGGGLFTKNTHPPAKKFNAGEKIIFWMVILLGAGISATGLSLLFPFEMPLFANGFEILNSAGLPQMLGFGALDSTLAPQEEMQWAQLWHAIIAFVFMALIIAHIYLGSVGMEGAYDSMSSGEVEVQWAKEHHSIWLEEVRDAERKAAQTSDTETKPTA